MIFRKPYAEQVLEDEIQAIRDIFLGVRMFAFFPVEREKLQRRKGRVVG